MVQAASVKIPKAKVWIENKVKRSVTLPSAAQQGFGWVTLPLILATSQKNAGTGHGPLKFGPPKPLALRCLWFYDHQ